jgi:hypothetical protein
MTAYEEIKLEERENTTLNNIRNLIQNGASLELISKSFGLSIQKIEDIIIKMKNSNN